MTTKKRFLVPLDGSERALLTCRHIAAFKPLHSMQAVLFHVFHKFPEAYFDAGIERSFPSLSTARAWQAEQHRQMQDYLLLARRMLVSSGFPEDAVEVRIQKRRRGVARDILREAGTGYEFVVARRRGMGALSGMIVGSVTLKLLQGLTFAPLMIAGQKAPGHRVLLGFDGSPGALRALRFVGRLLAPFPEFEICLMHVLRGSEKAPSRLKGILIPGEYAPHLSETITRKMETARSKLADLGVAPERVSCRLVPEALSRAAEIVRHAKDENFGIIVLGRRGVSRVQDFFIGRVTNKVLHLARDRSVWIVH